MGLRDLEARAREALGLAAAHARDTSRAAGFADEAVRLAEELDEPLLLADALEARLRTHAGPEDLDARLGTSLRLVALARQVPDTGVRLDAHLWRLATALEQLDLSTVRRQLAALDLLADETGEPEHRFHACSRRAMFALTEGDTVGAARLSAEAADATAAPTGGPGEDLVPGADEVLQKLHAELARQRGERTALVQQATSCQERGRSRDHPSLLAQAAVLWLEGGEPERSRELVDLLAPALDDLPRDADWLLIICKVCEAAAGSGRTGTAKRCASLLAPYAGRGVLDSRAVAFAGVVDDYLTLATRDRDQAARARAAYRRLGADWWARRGPLGRPHETVGGTDVPRLLHLHPVEGDGPTRLWCVGREGALRMVPSMHGLEYLRLLIERPFVDVPALDLSAAADPTITGSGNGTLVGQRALAEHRRRVQEGSASVRGRESPERSERARASIRRAILTALARLELHDGEVAHELRSTVRTGATYRYEPDPFHPVEWRLRGERHTTQSVGEP